MLTIWATVSLSKKSVVHKVSLWRSDELSKNVDLFIMRLEKLLQSRTLPEGTEGNRSIHMIGRDL